MAVQLIAADRVDILKTQCLGIGSYGAVYRAKCDQLPCAAKLLHPILVNPKQQLNMTRFEQECQFLSGIRHPNIVEYLGRCRDSESGLPVLLMELMDDCLTHFLEQSQVPLLYHTEVNLCYDVALALAYLHSKGIIHRDLSGNNVLLIGGTRPRAKVADFGMSKILDATPLKTPLTQCPGTSAYMPPEAFKIPPVYSNKLDCFSHGVVAIQIMTRQFPDPGPASQDIEDSRSPTGTTSMPVLETERRKSHINLIDPNHPLLSISISCLNYIEKNRPSAQKLCDQLATLREAPWDGQKILSSMLHEQQQKESKATNTAVETINLRWTKCAKAPRRMYRGSAIADGSIAYFRRGGSSEVYAYDSVKDVWSELPKCSHDFFSLVIVKGLLTAVGGQMSHECTNTLLSFIGNSSRKWSEHFPPMPTKRSFTAVVCSGRSLVVAGGTGDNHKKLDAVEVMDTDTRHWFTAASLPYQYTEASATICGGNLYLLGGYGESKSVLTCSLSVLIQSCQLQSLETRPKKTLSLAEGSRVWYQVAKIQVYESTCTTIRGQLLAVGGWGCSAVHMYNPAKNTWKIIHHTPTSLSRCLVAVLPNNKFMVVGGWTTRGECADAVEIASVL